MDIHINMDQIIEAGESDTVQFKESWHENNTTLVRDILGLANADSNVTDRILVIGLNEKGDAKGISDQGNNGRIEEIKNIFNQQFSNQSLKIALIKELEHKGEGLELLFIKVKPEEKYFFNKGYPDEQNSIVQAGVIYSRKNGELSELKI